MVPHTRIGEKVGKRKVGKVLSEKQFQGLRKG
jgi:hypothetical protein